MNEIRLSYPGPVYVLHLRRPDHELHVCREVEWQNRWGGLAGLQSHAIRTVDAGLNLTIKIRTLNVHSAKKNMLLMIYRDSC